jgi:hypothetical protein
LLKQKRATLKKEAKCTPLQVNDGDYFVGLHTENPRFIIVLLNKANPDNGEGGTKIDYS